MLLESLGWIAFFTLLAFVLYRFITYHTASENAHNKAAELGMVRMTKDTFWARLYRAISWRRESQILGKIANCQIPVILRKPILTAYIKSVEIDMRDVEEQDLSKYRSVNELFLRKVNASARPVADVCLVSPADCITYHFGKVSEDDRVIEDVKGFSYTLKAFFGEDIAEKAHSIIEDSKPGMELFFFIGYLSPADCHRYFSPADITLNFRRHFTGRIHSVVDMDLFAVNERMCATGDWKYGFFSFTAVGAIHVGEIDFYFDDRKTNISQDKDKIGTHDDRNYEPPVQLKKGDPFGQFAFGSVIALVFQAPLSFKFFITKGDKLQYGQGIGEVMPEEE